MRKREANNSRWALLGVLGVAAAVVTWLFVSAASSFHCSIAENVACASADTPKEYRGRLFDYQGRPAAAFVLNFHSDLYGRQFRAPVLTDAVGRFCVAAVPSTESSYIEVPGQKYAWQLIVRSDAPIDPRFRDPKFRESLRRDSNYHGVDRLPFMTVQPASSYVTPPSPSIWPIAAHSAVELWNPALDRAPSCQGVGKSAPWYKRRNPNASWQFGLLTLTTIGTLALFLAAIAARLASFRSHTAATAALLKATLATGLGTPLLAWILWAIA